MSQTVTIRGTSYTLPSNGDVDWAAQMVLFFAAIGTGTAPAVLHFGAASTPVNTTLNFLRPSFVTVAADTTQIKMACPSAGLISSLYVNLGVAATGGSTIVTILKGGVSQATTCTLAAAATTGSDTTHSFSVSAGDLLSVSIQHGGGISAGTTNPVVSFLLTQS